MRGEVWCGGGRCGKGGMGGMEYARARLERARDERAKEVLRAKYAEFMKHYKKIIT
jgi:hypothetical protein